MRRSSAPVGRHRGPVPAQRSMRRGRTALLAAAVAVSVTALVGGMFAEAEPGVADSRLQPTESVREAQAVLEAATPAPTTETAPTTEASPDPSATSTAEPSEDTPARSPVRRPVRVPEAGSGTFTRAAVDTELPGAVRTYSVEVEDNLPIKLSGFTGVVRRTLADPRGWTRGDPTGLVMTNGEADLRIVLTTPETTDRLCAPLQTRGRVSCRNGRNVVINAYRWVNGAESYGDDLAGYRRYVINHEVGHALGNGHEPCPEPGGLSPVMLQQTLGLQGCRSNPWPARVDLL